MEVKRIPPQVKQWNSKNTMKHLNGLKVKNSLTCQPSLDYIKKMLDDALVVNRRIDQSNAIKSDEMNNYLLKIIAVNSSKNIKNLLLS